MQLALPGTVPSAIGSTRGKQQEFIFLDDCIVVPCNVACGYCRQTPSGADSKFKTNPHLLSEHSLSEIVRKSIEICLQYGDRKSTRLNSSHSQISYAVFCL